MNTPKETKNICIVCGTPIDVTEIKSLMGTDSSFKMECECTSSGWRNSFQDASETYFDLIKDRKEMMDTVRKEMPADRLWSVQPEVKVDKEYRDRLDLASRSILSSLMLRYGEAGYSDKAACDEAAHLATYLVDAVNFLVEKEKENGNQ